MMNQTIEKVVNWMGAVMRPSLFMALVFGLVAGCATNVSNQPPDSSRALKKGSITIYRDEFGTPHVVADSNYGVYFGYGYSVASDRLFQMDMLRRTVRGRVAEVLGEKFLELDKHVRSTYDHRAVTQQMVDLDPQDREVLQAYADGFSSRVTEVLLDKATLMPKEFVDYDFLPEQWTAEDVAMIFIGSIIHRYSDFNSELDSLSLINNLAATHGREKAQRIFDASKWLLDPTSPTTVPRTENNAQAALEPMAEPSEITLDDVPTQRIVLDDDGAFAATTRGPFGQALAEQQIATRGYSGVEFAAASNFWSVTGRKLSDADGALVNGPQFGFGLPSYVYGIGLHGGDFNVVGNTLLGLPSLLFAHNNAVSWGSTAGMSDQVDVFQEVLVRGKPEHYRHEGQDKPFETWTETIKVRDSAPVQVTARRSIHGMVVSLDEEKGLAYTRARAWEGAELQTLMAWVNLAKDKTMDAVQRRLSGIAANINFYYMDVDGNLGYTHGGRYPLRIENHDSRVPAIGTGESDWQGYRPYSDNPTVRNPKQGFVVNWNNRPAPGWRSSDLWPQTWSQADRTSFLYAELEAKPRMSSDEVWALTEKVSYDDVSFSFLLPYLEAAIDREANAPTVDQAFAIIREWDREWRLEEDGSYGSAELIVETFTKNLFERVLKDDIGEAKFAMYAATNNPSNTLGPSMGSSVGAKVILRNLQLLKSGEPSYDFFNGENAGTVLREVFANTVDSLVKAKGVEMADWSIPAAPMTWQPYNFRGVPQAAEDTLQQVPAYMNRGSENNFFIARDGRFIAYDVVPPGQSGFVDPNGEASAHSADQMSMYSAFTYKPIPFAINEVEAVATKSKTIHPSNFNLDKTNSEKRATEHMSKIQTSVDKALKQTLGAFITVDGDAAIDRAKYLQANFEANDPTMPLLGVPIVVKDNIHVAGMPNSAGTLALKEFVPKAHNPVVQRLVDAGAIVIGKTNMHELAFGITSNNAAFGPVRNAIDPSLIAGGSSGGTAVAVAAGIVEMGLGTDTGGSTRIPPALNGVVGFRPTLNRYPSGGVTPVSSTRDTVGPIANTVSNTALLDCVIVGCRAELVPAELSGLRLGVPRRYFYENLSADVDSEMQQVLSQLRNAGVVLVEVEMPGLVKANYGVSFPVALYEFMQELPEYLQDNNTGVSMSELTEKIASPDVKGTVESQLGDQAIPLAAYERAINEFRPKLQAVYENAFQEYDVAAMIVPTTPLTATPITSSDQTVELNGVQKATFPTFIQNTDPTSNAGLPSLTLPAGRDTNGLPIGVMLDGPENSDRQLLSIGLAIEALLSADQ